MVIRIPRIKINRPKWQGWINDVLKLIERANNFRVERGGPIWIREDDAGTTIGFRMPDILVPGLTTASVAGGSYSAPVSTTVTILRWTGTAWTTTGGANVPAFNCYTNATPIAAGKMVWMFMYAGKLFIVAADCG